MKKTVSLCALGLYVCFTSAASTFSYNVNATVPDGDLNGYQNSQTVSGLSGNMVDVNVTLNISGGFNGDLYAFLSHNNTTAILLNRVGRSSVSNVGYPDTGFGPDALSNSFTLDDQSAQDVHFYRGFSYAVNGSGQLTGQWQPDGRAIDPSSLGSVFSGAARSSMLSVFNGMDPNGTWTLFVADASSGGESTLVGWGMQITVPEPASPTLILLGLAGGLCRMRSWRRTG